MNLFLNGFTWAGLSLFLASWGTFVAVACFSIALQVVYNRDSLSFRRIVDIVLPFEGWSSKSARIDLVMHFLARFTRRFYVVFEPLVSLAIAVQVTSFCTILAPRFQPYHYSYTAIIVGSVVAFLVSDLASYLSHYLRHSVPILWELHKVHHSATFLSPATAARVHPLEQFIDRMIIAVSEGVPLGLFGFLFGLVEAQQLLMIASVRTIGTAAVFEELKHSHFAVGFRTFDQVFLSPRMHQVHHSGQVEHFDRNFGDKLSIWDRLFGTMYIPTGKETWVYGLGTPETDEYQSMVGAYIGPLRKIGVRLARPLRRLWRRRRDLTRAVFLAKSDAAALAGPGGDRSADGLDQKPALRAP